MSRFKPLSMKEANIFILEKDLEKVGSILFDLKLMEFFKLDKKGFDEFEHSDNSNSAAKLLSLRSTITFLKKYYSHDEDNLSKNPIDEAHKLKDKIEEIEDKILSHKDEFKRQKILASLKVNPSDLDKKLISVGFVSKEDSDNLKLLKKEKSLIKTYELEERVYFTYKSDKKIPFSFKEFYLPKKIKLDLAVKIKDEELKLSKLNDELKSFANSNLKSLQREELKLSKQTSLIDAKSKFNKTQNFTVLNGFIPSKYVKKLQRNLEEELGNKFELDLKDAKGEQVPTMLNNSGLSGNFENLLKMYSLPRYGEFDPTLLMFLVFPLFYGFVLGDFGYGLISLIVFTLAKLKMPKIKEFLSILQISSISSMIFGIIYGEYFGFEPYHLFTRMEHPETLLAIAIIFGFIHLNIGLIVGFFNEIGHNIKHAIFDKLAWIVLQVGVGLLAAGTILSLGSVFTLLGSIIFVISVIMLVIGHGVMGIIEIPSFFTNALSYARLMAVGISSVVIAILVNEYSMFFFSKGIFGAIGGILLFTIGHIFNIILGNFESFLHTLRLHYVEFFTKFYSGGGREFEPFGKHLHNEDN